MCVLGLESTDNDGLLASRYFKTCVKVYHFEVFFLVGPFFHHLSRGTMTMASGRLVILIKKSSQLRINTKFTHLTDTCAYRFKWKVLFLGQGNIIFGHSLIVMPICMVLQQGL